MKKIGRLISKYLIMAIVPYFIFTWLLLSVILFVQQAGRFSDIFFSANIPQTLIWQLALALIPSVIAFTCPMAVLIGVIIGLSRMQGDSELVVLRAVGVGNLQITLPIIVLGILLSLFAFVINLKGVPIAAQMVRRVALQTALLKMESPIEPGVFNTEIDGFIIYVKNADFEKGTWQNIFIYNKDQENGQVRLITSKNGRIDSNYENSELYLENAVVTTFSETDGQEKFASENVGQIRLAIKTKRGEIIDKLSKTEETPEEMGLSELAAYARSKLGRDKTDAEILWQRRIMLSITPLVFALLGTALVLRFNRGGRGFGIFLALISLVVYYLLALLGEQLARTNSIPVFIGGLIPLAASTLAIIWFFLSNRFSVKGINGFFQKFKNILPESKDRISRQNFFVDLTTGILDLDILWSLCKFFLLTFAFLTSIFLIFTAFELWKFAGTIPDGLSLLIKYLLFLLPYIYIQLAPTALMVATLATFVIKSRQNEIVTWTAAGQSVYRLLFPCFALMVLWGALNWGLQEYVLPTTNRIQDELRSQIRNQGIPANKDRRYWVAHNNRIYSFELLNNFQSTGRQTLNNLTVYEFSPEKAVLQTIYKADEAVWENGRIGFSGKAEKTEIIQGEMSLSEINNSEIEVNFNPFNNLSEKPGHLNSPQTIEKIKNSGSELEKRTFETALHKKYTTLVLPLIITFFTAPFALSLSRKGKVVTIGYAVGIWLLFMGVTNTFEQFGLNGFISPAIAVWGPLLLFSMLGIYFLSRVKT